MDINSFMHDMYSKVETAKGRKINPLDSRLNNPTCNMIYHPDGSHVLKNGLESKVYEGGTAIIWGAYYNIPNLSSNSNKEDVLKNMTEGGYFTIFQTPIIFDGTSFLGKKIHIETDNYEEVHRVGANRNLKFLNSGFKSVETPKIKVTTPHPKDPPPKPSKIFELRSCSLS